MRVPSPRLPLTVLPLVAALLGAAPAAQAAIGVSELTTTPGTTQAAAASSFRLAFRLTDPGQQIKDLTIHLPPGLVGNPLAQPACPVSQFTADACPAATAVGTSQVNADPMNLTIDGTIYNLVPQAGEPARLGIIYRNTLIQSLFVQSSVALRAADGGLDSIIKDLPRQAKIAGLLPSDTTVKGINLTLAKTFTSNPTSCAPAVTRVDVTSYAAPTTTASGSASFTPTGCDKVPFAPRLTVGVKGVARGVSPALTTVITQAPGEAGIKGAVVTLPAGIGPNLVTTPPTCSEAQAAADACPDTTAVGTAAVRSPLLADELSGKVFLVASAKGLPTLRIDLRGALRIVLKASVGFSSTGQLQTTLDGIPDVPVSRFALSFRGGATGGVLANTDALCAKVRSFKGAFSSQAGTSATSTGAAVLEGCAPGDPGASAPGMSGPTTTSPGTTGTARRAPRATAVRTARGTVVLTVRAGTRNVRGVRVTLASRLTPGRRTTTPGRVRVAGRVVTVDRLGARGARRVVLRLRGGRSLRRTTLTVRVRDAGGRTTVLRVRVR